jgi:glycosyltransferase involved in cell wall biosynthesis
MDEQNINNEDDSQTVKEQPKIQENIQVPIKNDVQENLSVQTKVKNQSNFDDKPEETSTKINVNSAEKTEESVKKSAPREFQRHQVPALVQPPKQFQKQVPKIVTPKQDSINIVQNTTQNTVKEAKTSLQTSAPTVTPEKKKFEKHRHTRPPRTNGRNDNYRRGTQQQNNQRNVQTHGQQRINLNLSNKSVSVIIPLYNEEESLVELSISLKRVFESIKPQSYEVIFIDDGSTDSSFARIIEINKMNSRFKCIKFKRNYGKSAAISAGFNAAKGDYIITMDADLQDDPEEIPALIQKLQSGYDLVSGWKKVRHDPFIKKITSRLFNFATSVLVGLKLHDYNCGLKAYVKDVVKNVKVYGEMHRYIPALAFLSGFKVSEIPVTHHARKFGKTKFGASRFVNGLFDLMTVLFTTKYIKRPLHFFGFIGLVSFFAGFGILLYLTILKFFESAPIEGRPLFFVGILFAIVGMQFFSIGLIGEMITKSSIENDNIIIEKTL